MAAPQKKAWITRRSLETAHRNRALEAARTREYRRRQRLGHEHDLDAKKWVRYELTRRGWKRVSFESKKGYESTGTVDLVAVRKRRGDPNSIEVRLLQVKGYGARVSQEEREKLRKAIGKVRVTKAIMRKPGRGKSIQFEGMTFSEQASTAKG